MLAMVSNCFGVEIQKTITIQILPKIAVSEEGTTLVEFLGKPQIKSTWSKSTKPKKK